MILLPSLNVIIHHLMAVVNVGKDNNILMIFDTFSATPPHVALLVPVGFNCNCMISCVVPSRPKIVEL